MVLLKWDPQTVPLWVVHSYAFELRGVSAYLGIESPVKECGKTTLMSERFKDQIPLREQS